MHHQAVVEDETSYTSSGEKKECNFPSPGQMELVLSSEIKQSFPLQPAPDTWIHLHSVATSASLAAGAIASTLTHAAGTAATKTAAHTVSMVGSVLAHGARLVAGDVAGYAIQTGSSTASFVIEEGGHTATQVGALLASSFAAVAVGSSFLLGNTVYQIYKKSRFNVPIQQPTLDGACLIERIEELQDDILLLEFNTTSSPEAAVGDADVPTLVPLVLEPNVEASSESHPSGVLI